MTRADNDSWDLASSVGVTATMVAAARALATKEANPLIQDPYAEALVRAVGIDFFTRLVDGEVSVDDADGAGAAPAGTSGAGAAPAGTSGVGAAPAGTSGAGTARLMADMMAVRTRYYDDFFINTGRNTGAAPAATSDGVRQAVILASGLDSRAYRLPWPEDTVVYEIDQPKVIGAKTATMAKIGASPIAKLRTVAVDLRDDWPAALTSAGFDVNQPTAWSAEGLLVYLPPEAQDRLFDNITALSAPASQLATEYHADGGTSIGERANALTDQWGEHGFKVDLTDLFYAGERTPVADYLTAHGWQVASRTRSDVFEGYGRVFPESDLFASMRDSLFVTATRK